MLVAFCLAPPVEAREEGELRIACASNFYPTLKKLAVLFNEDHPQVALDLISGASGHLYQQIRHGAPYQLFLSADSAYPAALHRNNGSSVPRTYALGRLAIWDPRGLGLNGERQYTLAIANPATAPYGRAAEAAIARYRDARPAPRWRIVVAANVSQIQARRGEYRVLPADWHRPLVQQGVVVNPGDPLAEAFMAFLFSERAGRLIRAAGYALPGGTDALAR